ncbi:MAG: fibrobacter succinogenes major paralogous domain-containing protein [Bacteroidia bacterium]|nr:fibrobacter succinogenes major paralogous domain-containing protein [Bacteroidia bacterium]
MTIAILIIAMSSLAQETGTFTDPRDGKTYKTVKIGTQTWMAENLNYRTSIYGFCYNNDSSNCAIYGRLYTYYAALKVCPSGWHLPTDSEWTTLTDYLGGIDIAGGKLKSKKSWNSPNTKATNKSGFSGLPGGYGRFGTFDKIENDGNWWSSTEYSSSYIYPSAYYRNLLYNAASIYRGTITENNNYSVRCLMD